MIIHENPDGTYTYMYNRHMVEYEDGLREEGDSFLLYGYPNKKDCIKAVIRHYITVDEEFDLINSYNSPYKTQEDIDKYMNYLNLLKEIKTNVKKDFDEVGLYE